MLIQKAIIPAAGWGTRMLPAAKAVAKEMLPVLDRPTIQYVVEEAADAGIDDVLLVTSREKRSIEDHFDRHHELEERLVRSSRSHLLASIESLRRRVQIHSVRQAEQRGLGDAVLQAARHIGNEPFLCLLGDAIFSGDPAPARQLTAAFAELGGCIIGLEEVPAEKVERYGVVAGPYVRDGIIRISGLVEKPSSDSAPSRLAIAARYVLTPAIFDCLRQTASGAGGEIQLTDALRGLLEREPIHGVVLSARRHDIGNPSDWLLTNLLFAAKDPNLWQSLLPTLRALLEASRSC